MILATHGIIASKAAAGGYDADAQAFITAAGLTDTTQKDALNALVVSLKASAPTSATLWSKFYALYPMIGGTADTHKYNLKNPANTDAAYRLYFGGSWTHNSLGAIGSANGYADTYFNTNLLNINSASVWYYRRNDPDYSGQIFGVFDPTGVKIGIQFNMRNSGNSYSCIMSYEDGEGDYSMFRTGLVGLSRTVSTVYKRYGRYDGTATSQTLYTSATGFSRTSNTLSQFPYSIFINGRNVNGLPVAGEYSSGSCSFAGIANGFSDAESAALNTIIQTYQTALSRNVY